MNTKTVRQTITFKAPPHDIYEALMTPESTQNLPVTKHLSAGKSGEIFCFLTVTVKALTSNWYRIPKSCKHGAPVTGRKAITPKLLLHSKKSRAGQDFPSCRRASPKNSITTSHRAGGTITGLPWKTCWKSKNIPSSGLIQLSNDQAIIASFTPFPIRTAPER